MYGQWHGDKSNDRRMITMDLGDTPHCTLPLTRLYLNKRAPLHVCAPILGLVISNDGLHYREPLENFRMVVLFLELTCLYLVTVRTMG